MKGAAPRPELGLQTSDLPLVGDRTLIGSQPLAVVALLWPYICPSSRLRTYLKPDSGFQKVQL